MASRLRYVGTAGFSILVLATVCFAQAPGTYRVDPESSRIEIHVFRTGMLSSLGDNHVIGGAKFSGKALGAKDGSWNVEVHMESGSLRVLDAGISDSARSEIQSTMLSAKQLDVERYPAIELVARTLERGVEPHTMNLRSDLTLHGVTKTIDFPVTITKEGSGIEVKGKVQLRLRDFGIEPISKGLGTVKVKNEFEVVYDIHLHREGP
jgi:polyisoprenoid-binding protein YceI